MNTDAILREAVDRLRNMGETELAGRIEQELERPPLTLVEQYLRYTEMLDAEIVAGRCDDSPADAIRDVMDGVWRQMNPEEQREVRERVPPTPDEP